MLLFSSSDYRQPTFNVLNSEIRFSLTSVSVIFESVEISLLGDQENKGSRLSLSWSPRGELGVGVGAAVGFLGVGVVGCVFVLDMVLVACEL